MATFGFFVQAAKFVATCVVNKKGKLSGMFAITAAVLWTLWYVTLN
jgi:hypothetical protein